MAFVFTWDTADPTGTDFVSDGARVIREDVKGALNERLLSVFADLTTDPLPFKSITFDANNTRDIGATAVRAKAAYVNGLAVNLAVVPAAGDILIAAAAKLRLDSLAAGDTYIAEISANLVSIVAGGVNGLLIDATEIVIPATNRIYVDGGGNTYIYESSADRLAFVTGGSERFALSTTQAIFAGDLVVAATKQIFVDGGGDTSIRERTANAMTFKAGGTDALELTATLLTLPATNKIIFGDSASYIRESSNKILDFMGWFSIDATGAPAAANARFFTTSSTNLGAGNIAIGTGTAPTGNPLVGGALWVDGVGLKFKGSAGTITPLALL